MHTVATDCEVIFFVSSSGRCNLDCRYCIVEPAGRHEGSLAYEDLEFLWRHFGRKAFFMFSGKGDFFSGYPASERLLERLLDLDVEVGLDINATILQELPELDRAKLEKIIHVNVAMHWHELSRFGLRERWAQNARWILEHLAHGFLLVGTVMDPALAHEWDEALAFYEREIFAPTGKRLWLIRHLNHAYTPDEEQRLADVARRHAHMVETVLEQDYGALFRGLPEVSCPAGQRYFRVWNDGRVEGCPHVPELALLGGLKERVLRERERPYRCSSAGYCECTVPLSLGKLDTGAPASVVGASAFAGPFAAPPPRGPS